MSLGSPSPFLMILSFCIGIISSYTALILVERMLDSNRKKDIRWVLYGALIMGMGIFSMHFVGMIAYHIDASVSYEPMLLFVSFLVSILTSFAAFYLPFNRSLSKTNLIISGLIIGMGSVLMHHLAMEAMTLPFDLNIKSVFFSLSILIVLIFSTVGLRVFFQTGEMQTPLIRKISGAVMLGSGISLMHYTGMLATEYTPHSHVDVYNGMEAFSLGIIVSLTVLIILVVSIFLVVIDLRTLTSERSLLANMKESEERFHRLLELSPDPIVIHSGKEVVFVNEACLKLVNASDKSVFIGRSIIDFVPPAFKEIVKERILKMHTGIKAPPMEQQLMTPDGNIMDVEVTGVQIEFEGRPAIQLILRDIREQKRINRELEENRQRYQSLFENNPDGIYSMDSLGNLMDINQSLVNLLGYSKIEFSKMTFHPVVHEDDLKRVTSSFKEALEGQPQNYDITGVHKNGHGIPLNVTNMPIIVDGDIIGVFGIAKDISKEKEAFRLLEENEEKYRSLFEHNLDAVFELNWDGRFTDVNKMAEKLTKFSKEELYDLTFPAIIAAGLEEVNETFNSVKTGNSLHTEQKLKDKYGSVIEADVSVVPIRKQGEVDGAFSIVRDVTETKQNHQRINELAFSDQLTGLPNRHWFYKHLEEVLQKATEEKQTIAILIVDFDDFKSVNDLLGHHGGDLFLLKISERLKGCLSNNIQISRHGGDEFIIVVENADEANVRKLAERMLHEMNRPILLHDHELVVTLSIGISMHYDGNCDEEALIKQADLAMYLAKDKGKNNFQFFTEELEEKMTRKLQIENALRKAIEQEEFELHYQPQVDIKTEELVGLEALIRWNSSFGFVSPAEFIPIAEDTGLIIPIGEWVIKEACRQIKLWERKGFPKIKVSVNVSARQFKDPHFGRKVKNILGDFKVDTCCFEIEITESVMMNIEESSILIEELKTLGVKIAIDDFGAGYSSLNVIKNVEIDTLKIDKSLIDDITSNHRNMSILTAIIGVGLSLNTEVIIEGIESKEQVEVLKAFDVVGQGYYFSRPYPPEQLEHQLYK